MFLKSLYSFLMDVLHLCLFIKTFQIFVITSFMKPILFIILAYLIQLFCCESFDSWIFCTVFSLHHVCMCLCRDQEMIGAIQYEKEICLIYYWVTETCRRINGIY